MTGMTSAAMEKGTLIVGGGVVGLAVGWMLARRGEPVTLLEKGKTGREASWAAAGMLAPATEVAYQEDLNLMLGLESMRLYPEFVAELQQASGMDVDYRTEGALEVSFCADDTARLRHILGYQQEKNLPVRSLSVTDALEMEPTLSGFLSAAAFCGMDHQVDPRLLTTALKKAYLLAGGVLREDCEVTRFVLEAGRPPAVMAGEERISAKRVLLAAGAWSGSLAGLPDKLRPPVRPVKGQMLSFQMGAIPSLTHFLRVVRVPEIYMVPKSDGRLIVGATVEEMGFDRRLTGGGIYELLKGAWESVPQVYDLPLLETWTGFRPGSRDNAPILGQTAFPGLFVATGHHRNGILTTPATAVHMASLMLEGRPPDILKPFSPDRF
ncbi:MAG: glycine oxidase ThiO [Deltaproteobacteria bacterium]|nr:glycine oxidase ThiO [Deltaproteobacteria bacterium]